MGPGQVNNATVCTDVRLSWKDLPRTNTLAYYKHLKIKCQTFYTFVQGKLNQAAVQTNIRLGWRKSARDKRSSLLRTVVNYGRIRPRSGIAGGRTHNIRLGWKGTPGTNTQAYYERT